MQALKGITTVPMVRYKNRATQSMQRAERTAAAEWDDKRMGQQSQGDKIDYHSHDAAPPASKGSHGEKRV